MNIHSIVYIVWALKIIPSVRGLSRTSFVFAFDILIAFSPLWLCLNVVCKQINEFAALFAYIVKSACADASLCVLFLNEKVPLIALYFRLAFLSISRFFWVITIPGVCLVISVFWFQGTYL